MKARIPAPPPRKRPSQERSKSTVASILQAASEVVMQEGGEQASVAAIVRRAGVSAGTFYQYFPNKEALLAALLQHQYDTVGQIIRTRLQLLPDGDTSTRVRNAVQVSIDVWRDAGPALRALHCSVAQQPLIEPSEALRNQMLNHLKPILSKVTPERRWLAERLAEALICGAVRKAALEGPDRLELLQKELPPLLLACFKHLSPGSA